MRANAGIYGQSTIRAHHLQKMVRNASFKLLVLQFTTPDETGRIRERADGGQARLSRISNCKRNGMTNLILHHCQSVTVRG